MAHYRAEFLCGSQRLVRSTPVQWTITRGSQVNKTQPLVPSATLVPFLSYLDSSPRRTKSERRETTDRRST
jgi:hypothetical protein